MESKQGIRSGVEDIISEVNCERDCECHNSGFENLGRVTIFGEADLVECLEDRAKTCESAVTGQQDLKTERPCPCPAMLTFVKLKLPEKFRFDGLFFLSNEAAGT
ncbi:MAG: hypothetical protein ACYSTG_10635 [Planctomycetota bacterium]